MESLQMFDRLTGLVKYNKDWIRYAYYHYFPPPDQRLIGFRLRNGMTVKIYAGGRFILNEIFLGKIYDVPGLDFSKLRNVLDLGANVGVFAMYIASRARRATTHCVEPSADNFDTLVFNIQRNKLNAVCYNCAITAEPGFATLSTSGTSVEHAVVADASSSADSGIEQVRCMTLEDLFDHAKVEHFDYAKIDIEGSELEVLEATPDDLLSRIGALSIEWHHGRSELDALAERLRKLGFGAKIETIDGCLYVKALQGAIR
jgi:FkbM family methyltransferase